MATFIKRRLGFIASNRPVKSQCSIRKFATQVKAKKEGDISSVFVSLSGASPMQLPDHFAEIKRNVVRGNTDALVQSWKKLLKQLSVENEVVAQKGPDIIPQIEY